MANNNDLFLGVLVEKTDRLHDSGYPMMNIWGLPTSESFNDASKRVLISGNCDVLEMGWTCDLHVLKMDVVDGMPHLFYRYHMMHIWGVDSSNVKLRRGPERKFDL